MAERGTRDAPPRSTCDPAYGERSCGPDGNGKLVQPVVANRPASGRL
jgi:hypothetical protein